MTRKIATEVDVFQDVLCDTSALVFGALLLDRVELVSKDCVMRTVPSVLKTICITDFLMVRSEMGQMLYLFVDFYLRLKVFP